MAATASADAPTGAGAAGFADVSGLDFGAVAGLLASVPSTSAFTMRPRGPEPLICARWTPLSAAIRRARGEAKIRFPLSSCGAAGALVSDVFAAGVPLPEPSPSALVEASGASVSGAAAFAVSLSMSSALSPSSRSTAMGVLTFTPSVPSGIRILPMVPSSTASNSIVALSVSISARRSPELTSSPSLTSHFASVPSSIVGDRAGMSISVGIALVSLTVGDRAHSLDHLGGGGQRQFLEIGGIGHRHVLAGAVDDRSVQIVERAFHQRGRDVVADRRHGPAFFHGHAAIGFHDRGDDGVVIQRTQGAQVDHLGADAVLGQFVGGFHGIGHADPETDDGDIGALAPDARLAEGDGEIVQNRNLEAFAVEDLVFKDHNRVGIADRGFQQALGVGGRIGLHDLETGDLGIPCGVILTVLRAHAGGRAVGTTEYHRTAHLTTRHIERLGGGVDDLVDCLHGEVPCHEFHDRAQTAKGRTDA